MVYHIPNIIRSSNGVVIYKNQLKRKRVPYKSKSSWLKVDLKVSGKKYKEE